MCVIIYSKSTFEYLTSSKVCISVCSGLIPIKINYFENGHCSPCQPYVALKKVSRENLVENESDRYREIKDGT